MNKHGNMNLSWIKDLFIIEVEGPFNEDGIKFWFSELQKSVKNRGAKDWRRLEIWNEEASGSPESIDTGKLIYDWYEENGCVLTPVVVSNSLQEHIIKNMFVSSAKIFRDKETAQQWLGETHKNLKRDY